MYINIQNFRRRGAFSMLSCWKHLLLEISIKTNLWLWWLGSGQAFKSGISNSGDFTLVRPCLRGIHLILLSESTQEGTVSREGVNIKNIKTLLTTPSFLMRSISSRIPSSARSMFFFLFLSLISAMLEILELRCRSSSSALSSRLFSFWVSFSTASSWTEIVSKIQD